MNTVFKHYAAALLPFFILVIGASQTVLHAGFNLQVDIPFAVLVLGAIITFIVQLLPSGWQGALKTGVAIVTTILSALLPFVLPGTVHLSQSVPVVAIAILNAIATEFGVQIRTAPMINAGTAVPGVAADISSLPPTTSSIGILPDMTTPTVPPQAGV